MGGGGELNVSGARELEEERQAGRADPPTSALSLIGQKVCLLPTNYKVSSFLETLGTVAEKSVSQKPPTSPLIRAAG